jgi:hypothetical protein
MTRLRTILTVACVIPLMFVGMGCYETKYPLGSESGAVVDPAYVGDFTFMDRGKTVSICVRNIDDHLYYAEWAEPDKDPLRMVGYMVDVNGATFVNLRELKDDGSIDKSYILMRVSISDDRSKLTIRNLKDDFFKGVDSADALQKLIAGNLDNNQMYDSDAVVAMRVTPPSSQPGT